MHATDTHGTQDAVDTGRVEGNGQGPGEDGHKLQEEDDYEEDTPARAIGKDKAVSCKEMEAKMVVILAPWKTQLMNF